MNASPDPHPAGAPARRAGLLLALLTALLAALPVAAAQPAPEGDPVRVVVAPFGGDEATGPLAIGLAGALQRAVNTLDGHYAPPLGDVVVVTQRAQRAELDPFATLDRFYDPTVRVGGEVTAADGVLELALELGGESEPVAARGSTPAALARAFGEAFLDRFASGLSTAEQNAFLSVLDETPSAASLGSATLSASLLPGVDLGDLQAAADLDSGSSWVRSEYARQLLRRGEVEAALEEARRATELNAADVEAQLVLARALQRSGDPAAADAYRAALEINPAHPLALIGLAQLDAEGRAARLEAAIDANPRLLEAYLFLAELQPTAQGRVQTLRRAAPHLLDSATYHREVVRAILAAGDARGALGYLRDTARQPLAQTPALYALADLLPPSLAGDAEAFVAEGLERFPDAPELGVTRARQTLDRGEIDAAIDALETLLADTPGYAPALNTLAVAYARQGRTDEARDAFERIEDPSLTGQLNLALIYLEAGRVDAALNAAESVVERAGGVASASADQLAVYGSAAAFAGDAANGRAALERALELDPDNELAASALQQLEQRSELGIGPDDVPSAARADFDRGLFALNRGDFASAAAAFAAARDAAGEADGSGLVAYYHGLALLRAGDARSAADAYRASLERVGPAREATVLGNLGFAYLRLGRYDLALDALQRSSEADPSLPQTQVSLGLTYYGLGRYSEALAAFERAVELDPSLEAQLAQVIAESERRTP